MLDLFAGSGALGIEALSRGALRATFVDDHPRSIAAVRPTSPPPASKRRPGWCGPDVLAYLGVPPPGRGRRAPERTSR